MKSTNTKQLTSTFTKQAPFIFGVALCLFSICTMFEREFTHLDISACYDFTAVSIICTAALAIITALPIKHKVTNANLETDLVIKQMNLQQEELQRIKNQ